MKLQSVALAGILFGAVPAWAAPLYTQTRAVALGAPDRWDYVTFDDKSHLVFVAHGDRVTVVNPNSGTVVREVTGIPGGTHGIAISSATGQGFTDDGRNGKALSFSLSTFKITHEIPAAIDADGIAFDRATDHIFVIEGDPGTISVIDPKTDKVVSTIKAGEKLEFAVADDQGTVYVAGEEKSDVLKIDARTNRIVARWAAPDCSSPHGIALDRRSRRLFLGCLNSVLMVVDTDDGRIVAKLPIGRGSDAVAFDSNRKRVFSSNGIDGTITVYQQTSANNYVPADLVVTQASARTMAVDSQSGRLFVAAADSVPGSSPKGRPVTKPGSLKLLIFDVPGKRRQAAR